MSDLVGRIETRIHDSPMPIEHLLDACADEIRRLQRIERVNNSLARQLADAMKINATLCEDNKRLAAQVTILRSQVENDGMVRLSANEAACYRWPEDTAEHRAMRAAYMDGAASHSPPNTIAEILQLCDEAPMEVSTWSEEVRRVIERAK